MTELILGSFFIIYLLMALRFFTIWLAVLKQDTTVTPEEKPQALITLVVVSTLWLFVVPFAYLELLKVQDNSDSSCSFLG